MSAARRWSSLLCPQCRRFSTTNQRLMSKHKDVYYEEKLPVHEYNQKNWSKNRLYVFGFAKHGGLGLENLIKPKEKDQKQYFFMWKPVRHRFAESHEVTDAVAGHGFSLIAIKPRVDNGPIVFGCGDNTSSQLGFQAARHDAPLGTLLSVVPLPIAAKKSHRVNALGAGRAHSIISIGGVGLFTLGDNSSGQCGRVIIPDEQYFGSKYLHKVRGFQDDDVVSIASRFDVSYCVTTSGKVYSFGSNEKGQLGRGKLVFNSWEPEQVKGDLEGEKVLKVVTSGSSALAMTESGELFGWGCNECGQTDPEHISTINYFPKRIPLHKTIGKIKDLAIGDFFSFILNEQGMVYVWGQGRSLGLGPSKSLVRSPTLIPPPLFGMNRFSPDVVVVSISSSFFYAGAINSVGDLFMWGKDSNGCLGLGKMNHQPFPLRVALGSAAKKISLGIDHSVTLAKGGL